MDINSISVSRIGVWQECEQRYKFKYHLKVESPEPEQEHFTYGKLIHKIIESYTRGEPSRNIVEIKKACLNGEIPIDDNQDLPPSKRLSSAYLAKVDEHIRSFLRLTEAIGLSGECEVPFEYDLDPPNNKVAKGFIDRLIIQGDKATIIDYKTSKKNRWRKTAKTVLKDLQLRTYCLVVWKKYNIDPRNIRAFLYYVEGEDLVGAKFGEKTLNETHLFLRDTYNRIEEKDADTVRGRVGDHCYRCDYHSQCPFFSLT